MTTHLPRGHPLVVVHDAVCDSGMNHCTIGDLVLTGGEAYYLPYAEFRFTLHHSVADVLVRGAMTGALGGLLHEWEQQAELRGARRLAGEVREANYGRPVGDRFERAARSIPCGKAAWRLPAGDIEKVTVGGSRAVSVHARDGVAREFLVPGLDEGQRGALAGWPGPVTEYDAAADPDGLLRSEATPEELIRRFADGEAGACSDVSRLALDARYATQLAAALEEGDDPLRLAFLGRCAAAPAAVRAAIAAAIARDLADVRKRLGCSAAVAPALLFLLGACVLASSLIALWVIGILAGAALLGWGGLLLYRRSKALARCARIARDARALAPATD